jgi:tetratricopeptide (TPR) repeat protein
MGANVPKTEHHAEHEHHHEAPMTPEEAVRSLLVLGQVALNAGDYESAIEAYGSILQLEQNEVALYNLGSLYARGLGLRQDYVEAARLFRQAELMGNEQAGKLCAKCMFDYLLEGLDQSRPSDLYAEMAVFVTRVYPEAEDQHRALDEAIRVTKPGGIILAAFLSAHAIICTNYLYDGISTVRGLEENFDSEYNVRHFKEQLFTGFDIAEFEELFTGKA